MCPFLATASRHPTRTSRRTRDCTVTRRAGSHTPDERTHSPTLKKHSGMTIACATEERPTSVPLHCQTTTEAGEFSSRAGDPWKLSIRVWAHHRLSPPPKCPVVVFVTNPTVYYSGDTDTEAWRNTPSTLTPKHKTGNC